MVETKNDLDSSTSDSVIVGIVIMVVTEAASNRTVIIVKLDRNGKGNFAIHIHCFRG